MALAAFNSAAFTAATGLAIAANATVEVRRESDSGLAAIFSDEAGTIAITNPSAFVDSEGRFIFYVAGSVGGYSIEVTKGAEVWTLRHVAIGTAAQYDAASFATPPPFDDATAIIKGSADATKLLRFEVDAITTATTRVLTWPDANLTIPAVTTKGDIVAASAADVLARLGVGSDGQIVQADSGETTGLIYRDKVVLGTSQASTSGTSIDFTGIPAWVKEITVMFVGVSTTGTSPIQVRIGDSGGIETSGYSASVFNISAQSDITTGFQLQTVSTAAVAFSGSFTLNLENAASFTWVGRGGLRGAGSGNAWTSMGDKALTATLDRVSVTTAGGADTFDLGEINISY